MCEKPLPVALSDQSAPALHCGAQTLNIGPMPSSSHIDTVRFAETANFVVLEPQNRLDVFVGKIARCG